MYEKFAGSISASLELLGPRYGVVDEIVREYLENDLDDISELAKSLIRTING
jgi:hypothetical protein